MFEPNKVYTLKNGTKVLVKRSITDYFSNEEYIIGQVETRHHIFNAREFEANLAVDNLRQRSTKEKIKLYRSYFKGRDTMVAASFRTKEGKMGYYPLCNSRFNPACPKQTKAAFKCANYKMQNFQPITDELIFNHLKGTLPNGKEAFYGMYPILSDNTVYFLAIDFDKHDWKTEVKALTKACHNYKLKPLLELSQSGNGCHVWLFFETPIEAKHARKLGDLLLAQAMKENPKITFEAYDRMFPNQDELPSGGFGNLIALPLQGMRVNKGCSRFIDSKFKIIPDVWEGLAKTPKISEENLTKLIGEMQVDLPLDFYREDIKIKKVSSEKIKIILASEIKIKHTRLAKKDVVKLKQLATFSNKAYYEALGKRLPTKDIPRLISLASFDDEFIYLPRGLEPQIREMFPKAKWIDKRVLGTEIDVKFSGDLYPEQAEALAKLAKNDMGILSAGTGFGKTVLAAKLIAEKKVSTLILVNNKTLATQWKSQIERFLGVETGMIYGGKTKLSSVIDIGLFQSMTKKDDLPELLGRYGMVIVDEVHHVAAKTFEDVIKQASAKFIYGLSATPKREDGLEKILYMRMGEVAYKAEKISPKHIDQILYTRFSAIGEDNYGDTRNTIHENYQLMMNSDERNKMVVDDIVENVAIGRHLIVLSRYVEHVEILRKEFVERALDVPVYILNSKMKAKILREELEELKAEGKPFVLFTTGSYAGEGFDLPALDTLMLAMPISSKGSLQQYLGRLLRNLEEKEELRVYDYVDFAIPMIYRMYQKRLPTYRKLGYVLTEDDKSGLYKSNFFEASGAWEVLFKDLAEARNRFVLVVPFLSNELLGKLLDKDYKCRSILVVPPIDTVKVNFRARYTEMLRELGEAGFEVVQRCEVKQSFAMVDDSLVWLMPDGDFDEGKIATRLYSKELARKLMNYFELK
ncbi:MAG: DEAD/DEAH box helicase family protein [Lactobacillales bacterium]|jgi:superfamily II DNA or RNA helicase|nr:DEAD/DEAH box helicase family protein [Lactobacillales bacterium]